ncbi:monothiol glutaredoxin-S4, mitochondrial isoform X2 [Phoenix dactylifera]|uniref:Monothiol glutaredoxin-S4, mitochondrial isoform X2 n=1 Tax=Phoenix dactylifera TaxID=42345 RepID=A0A8B7C5A5_PHODC|nr:monothiol glutaredoxin-S4, mitochondrial isoform X2 [Phoenix dactylifera]
MLRRLALGSASITAPAIRPLDKNLLLGRVEGSLPPIPRLLAASCNSIDLHQIGNTKAIDEEHPKNSDELSGGYFADILKTRKIGSKVALGLAFQPGMKYSTRVSGDPDTHEDFLPTNKSSGISVQDVVQQEVKENAVMIYMKGLPDAPRCGFSALAVKVLQQYRVPISARDILGDPKVKEGVKAYTNWPTFPQIFIKGEFVGGSDIIFNMHQGELKDLLADIAQDSSQGGA